MNRTLRAAALAATATLAVALGSCRSGSRPEPSARAVGTALSTTPPAPSPFGGELALDPPVVGTVTASGAPGVASDGTGFLVGWSGGVARVSAAGGLLDAPAITVAAAGPVAFDGQSYWSLSVRNVPTGPGLSSTILSGTRLSGAGAVLDSSPILLLPGPSAGDANLAAWPALAGTASTVLAAAEFFPLGSPSMTPLIAVGDAGGPLGPSIGAGLDFTGLAWAAAAASATGYAVIHQGHILLADTSGIAGASATFPLDAGMTPVANGIGSDGANWLAVTAEYNGSTCKLLALRYDQVGIALDAAPVQLATKACSWSAFGTSEPPIPVLFDGTNYVVVWVDAGTLKAVAVSPSTGQPVAGSAASLATGTYAALAHALGADLLAFQGTCGGNQTICAARVNTAARPIALLDATPFPVAQGQNAEQFPAVGHAPAHARWLVAWEDFRRDRSSTAADVYGVRVDSTGTPIDGSAIAIGAGAGADRRTPVVAGAGAAYLVAWRDTTSGTISAQRVADDGSLAGGAIGLGNALSYPPAAASDGTGWLASWVAPNAMQGPPRLLFALVAADGTVTGPTEAAPTLSTTEVGVAAAWAGSDYLLAWLDDPGDGTASNVYGARVSSAGTPGPRFPIAALADHQKAPAVACAPSECLVVWQDRRGGVDYDVYGARVTQAGVIDGSGIPIFVGAGDQANPAVAWDGSRFVITWVDGPATTATALRGTTMALDGTVLAGQPFAVVDPAVQDAVGALSSDGAGRTLLGYHADGRARTRLAAPKALGAPCAAGTDCGTGFCADGVCCDGACGGDACTACNLPGKVGTCSPSADGTACSDGNACTQSDACQAGVCTGASPVICTAADQCHTAGTCNPATGACSSPAKANGTTCDDGNACTQSDTCQAGVCSGASPVICTAADQCHAAGTCNPATGACSSPAKSDGTACDDGNACTQSDACQAGVCTGANPVTCSAQDQCHAAGTCNPATGACSSPAKANGTACSDGNACTQSDACQAGVCAGTDPISCPPPDECHTAACTASSGACASAPVADGTPCTGGACHAGACAVAAAGGKPGGGGCGSGGGAASPGAALGLLALALRRRRSTGR